MPSKIKTLLSVLAVALLLIAGTIATAYIFEDQQKVEKPFAQVGGEEEEEEECPPEECGGVSDSESDEDEEAAEADEPTEPTCSADTWSCGEWSACSLEGKQTRACKITEDCVTAKTPSPSTSQSCEPPKPACEKDTWDCGSWSTCQAEGIQTRNCSLKNDCEGVETPKPSTKQSCEPPKSAAEEKIVSEPKPVEPVKPAAEEKPAVQVAPVEQKQSQEAKPAEPVKPAEEAKPTEIEEKKTVEETPEISELAPELQKIVVAAEAEITKQVEEEIQERKEEIKEFTKTVSETPVFQKLIEAAPTPAIVTEAVQDVNANGVPDKIDRLAGIDPSKADSELVRQEALLAAQKEVLVKGEGKSRDEADQIIANVRKQVRSEHKVKTVREVAEKVYNRKIRDHRQDSNNDGVSDEAAVLMGLDPNKRVNENATFSDAEKFLYGVDDSVAIGNTDGWKPRGDDSVAIGNTDGWTPKGDGSVAIGNTDGWTPKNRDQVAIGNTDGWMPRQRVAAGILAGSKFSTGGFTVLAAGPAGGELELVATDKNGRESVLARRAVSENSKVAFVVPANQVREGTYIMQVREARMGRPGAASVIAAAGDTPLPPATSPAVPVKVVAQSDISDPVVKNIQDVDVAGLKDIRVTTDAKGRVKVTGSADIDATVIGTFESAVYTAAILSDVSTGQFEVISPKPLEGGAHDVVVYASRTEEGIQSRPVQLAFTVIEEKSTGKVEVTQKSAAAEKKEKKEFPLIPVAGGIGIVLLLAVAFILRKKKA